MKVKHVIINHHKNQPWIENGKRQIYGIRLKETSEFPLTFEHEGVIYPLWYKGKSFPCKTCKERKCKCKAEFSTDFEVSFETTSATSVENTACMKPINNAETKENSILIEEMETNLVVSKQAAPDA